MLTLEPQIRHDIDPLDIVLIYPDRPNEQHTAKVVFEVEDRMAVASAHSEGFWILPLGFSPFAQRAVNMAPVATEWVPHPDTRFRVIVRR